ncbi:MAG: cytochrome c maturation protein CcmE, partial [Candidatus Methanoperedens sp.]|nr:cytochrome c maturation protein CcmE [Candidatus Methanoperedens sp.]
TLTFKMTDGIATLDVVYTGDKPDLPPEATDIQAVVTGQFNNNVFEAFRMLTKCPSKYESNNSIYTPPAKTQ